MEGPRDPKIYRAPELEGFPPSLEDAVGVFSGFKVSLERKKGEVLMVVEGGNRKYLMKP